MKQFFFATALLFGLLASWSIGQGANYPVRPIQLIVPFDAGGTTDLSARVLASAAERILGQPVTVVNRSGGGGVVGVASVANARPDGYTIGILPTGPASIAPHMRELPFNPLEDFEYLLQYTYYISALTVNADSDVETMEDFIERVREDPTTIVGMSGGAGQPQHLVLEQVKQVEDVEWVWQSYQGGAPTMTALLGNHIDAAAPGGEMIPMARAGQVRMIAILNDMRLEEFPDVPTLMDLGYDFSVPSLVGLVAPKDTPGEILQVLEEAFLQATEDPEFIAAMNNILMPVLIRDSSDFYSYVEHMYNVNREVINELGLGMDQ